jgi:AcrR family transcriptional regulator
MFMALKTRERILASARSLIAESSKNLSAAQIARRSEISRSSIYEYFPSTHEIYGELLLRELADYRKVVGEAIELAESQESFIGKWVEVNLAYICDGRHAIARALMPLSSNSELVEEIRAAHIRLFSIFHERAKNFGLIISTNQMTFINSVIESAAKKIEGGATASDIEAETTAFIFRGIKTSTH